MAENRNPGREDTQEMIIEEIEIGKMPEGREGTKKENMSDNKEEIRTEEMTETKPEAQAESTPETKPEAQAESTPETKPEIKAESAPEVHQEIKTEDKPVVRNENKPQAGAAGKDTQKIDKKIFKVLGIILGVIAVILVVFFLFFYKNKKVRATEAAITSIGEVTLDSEAAITEAEQMYAELNDKEKRQVENTEELKEARDLYTELCDKDAAYQVDLLIDLIGEVDRSSERSITDARKAYDALTGRQKQYVEKLAVLEQAEADFEVLDVKECEELIDRIQYAAESPDVQLPIAIDAARTAYEALSPSHKKLVKNYSNLETAEKAYDDYVQKTDALKIKKEHEERLQDREKYMNSCQVVTYAQLISNPETYEGKDIAIKVDIVSVEAAKFLKSGSIVAKPAGGRDDNVISLIDGRSVKEPEFTEKSTLTVYGEFNGVNTITSYKEGSGVFGSNLFADVDSETMVPEIRVEFTSTDDIAAIDEKPTTTEIFNYIEEGIDIAKGVTDILRMIPW